MNILNHTRNKRIKFDESSHTYEFFPDLRKSEGEEFFGVTSWIKQFEPHKDWKGIAFGSSKNPRSEWYGMEVDDILNAWKEKGNESREVGNNIHKAIEDCINLGVYNEEYAPFIDAFWETMDANEIKPVVSELVLYDESIKRSSPLDIVGTKDGQVVIVDTKTFAKGMEWQGYNGECFEYPLNHLQTSKYNKTCLQTSVYKYWGETLYGWDMGQTYVFLINEEGYELIPTLYLEDEVKQMYEYTKKTPWE